MENENEAYQYQGPQTDSFIYQEGDENYSFQDSGMHSYANTFQEGQQ